MPASPLSDSVEPLSALTLQHLLARSVERHAPRPALCMVEGETWTYAQLGAGVRRVSAMLAAQEIRPGDRVAILSENRPEWGLAYFAATTMGAVAVPILPDFHPDDVLRILDHAEARALFVSRRQLERIQRARTELPEILQVVDDLPSPTDLSSPADPSEPSAREAAPLPQGSPPQVPDSVSAAPQPEEATPRQIEEDDMAVIIYTSGTTGHSKGVVLTHRNLVFDAQAALSLTRIHPQDRFLSVLPLSHTYECTVGFLVPMMQGASVYYLDKPPVPRVLLPALRKVRPTVMMTVPLIMEKIFRTRIVPSLTRNAALRVLYRLGPVRRRLHRAAVRRLMETFGGQLRLFGIGGALLAADVEAFLRDGGFPYTVGYGLTETAPLVAGCAPEVTRFRSTGVVLPGVEVRIHEPDPRTGEGEIWVRGPNVMRGYYQDPQRTAEVLTQDGWFRTGDLGVLDEDGYLYIRGRLKNVIVGPSGENIYPEELEAALCRSPYVQEALVYSHEERLVARVYLDPERVETERGTADLDAEQRRAVVDELLEEIRRETNARIAAFCRLQALIEQPEEFVKTPTRKIKRYLYVD